MIDEKIRNFLFSDWKGKVPKNTVLHGLILIAVTVIAVLLRVKLFPYESGDYVYFLRPWSNHFAEESFSAVAGTFYDYTPLYMYLLYFCTKLPISLLTAIKCFSVLADFMLALGVALIVQEFAPNACRQRAMLNAYALTLLLPTVFLNSAMWAQCDGIYASFVVWSFYLLLRGKNIPAFICYGVAFSLKLQAIFFLPILLLLWATDKRVKLWNFLEIPAVYFVSVIPAWIAGRPLGNLLTIYLRQTGAYTYAMTYKYPNLYYLIDANKWTEMLGGAGVLFTFGILLVIAIQIFSRREDFCTDRELLFSSVLLILLTICFFLPYMHERYGYLVEIFALLYALICPKRVILPILISFTSTAAYFSYFTGNDLLPMAFLALLNLASLILTAYYWIASVKNATEAIESN